jgi:Inner membrane protein YgaP-like, transmembrane domain
MHKNIGTVDRVIRTVVGVALLTQAFAGPLGPAWWGWIGIVPLATVLLGWCPAYSLIGVRTCREC